MDPVKLMKQEVGRAAAAQVKSGTVVGTRHWINDSICDSVYWRADCVGRTY